MRADKVTLLIYLFTPLLVYGLARVLASTYYYIPAAGVLIAGLILITLVNPEFGLYVLLLSMLLSPEIRVAEVPQRAVVIRLDDIFLGVIFFTWLLRMALRKELGLLRATPLNRV